MVICVCKFQNGKKRTPKKNKWKSNKCKEGNMQTLNDVKISFNFKEKI